MKKLISLLICLIFSTSCFAGIPGADYHPTAAAPTIGTLPVNCGGTGVGTLTLYGVVVGSGTSAVHSTAAGTNGYPLVANTSADPTFQFLPIIGGGTGATSLAAYGVLVMNSGGTAATSVAPGANTYVLTSNGTSWTSAAASGGVTSVTFTGDGTVLSATPSSAVTTTGTLTAAIANAAAMKYLANPTTSSAAPVYTYGLMGSQTLTATSTTLTASSPSVNVLNNSSNSIIAVLPAASTCPGKVMSFPVTGNILAHTAGVTLNAADTYVGSAAGATIPFINRSSQSPTAVTTLTIISGGSAHTWYPIVPHVVNLANVYSNGNTGELLFASSFGGAISTIAVGTTGQLLQAAGGSVVPTYTSTPGSAASLTSITTTHQIGGGTAPTIAAGAGAGTSPTIGITGHDTSFTITLTTGTTPSTGVIATVTFGTAYASAPYKQMTATGPNSDALVPTAAEPYPTSTTTTLVLQSGATALTAATQYIWDFHCSQ